ncbi:penicillin-binding protein 2 [Marmoricola sp. Leaf446]|uniref:peptidoglycan D,D-transpeptidase FtsI family protein n=1 Tax=Marmoricola sp. Leaf446 TaxID=1736379 RepID=UPI000B13CD87|nr:penicillin-binding protein 2 [Marmoricola sp. Leaf446]
MSPTRRSSRGTTHLRLRVALIGVAMLLSLFAGRLVQIQGIDAASYAARAESSGLVTLDLPAKRGRILDRNGEPLAESVAGLMVVADPQTTAPNADAIARILADRLDLDYFEVRDTLTEKDTRFAYVARRVPSTLASSVVAELREQELTGIDTRPDPLRSYPSGDVAGNVIGFLGENGKPAAGLELAFDDLLAGKDGRETYEVGGGNRIPLGDNTRVAPVDGKDLRLTIDRDVQWYAQRVLCNTVQTVQAESGVAVAMDTRTGELLALADCTGTEPGMTPAEVAEAQRKLVSSAVSDVYEPGSVQKVLTFSSLIDDGKVAPETKLTVPSELPVLDRVIGDWFDHGTLQMTVAGVVAQSSNIGTSIAAGQFTPQELHDHLTRFGLGQKTGVGLPGESRGLLTDASEWSVLSRAQIAFGQGLSVNALQMAAAVNALGNDGELVEPSIVEGRERTSSGQEVGTATATKRRAVSSEAARKTAEMMELVTTPDVGTAPGAGIQGYRVAGKTGTAQQAGGECRCYAMGGKAVSFGGFAPADDPRFTVYAMVNKPSIGGSGGGTTGPIFRKILAYLLQKYAVAPTGTLPPSIPTEWSTGQDLGVPSPSSLRPGQGEVDSEDLSDGADGTSGAPTAGSTTGSE